MNSARVVLIAFAVLGVLSLAAAAWAAPGGDGGSRSGGARALPVVPSSGGSSEPAPEVSDELGGVPDVTGEQPAVTPPIDGVASPAQSGTETEPEEEIIVPLEDQDAETNTSPNTSSQDGESSGGGFSFLASTGFEIASLVTVGVGLLVTGVLLRGDRRPKTSR